MILLIGICTNFTKNPMNPMIRNPIPVAMAILENSKRNIMEFQRKKKRKERTFAVWFGAFLHKINRILDKFLQGIHDHGVDV
jgi:hypothetical protein